MLLLTLVLVVSLAFSVRQEKEQREGKQEYSDAETISGFSPHKEKPGQMEALTGAEEEREPVLHDPYAVELSAINLAALREVNRDVIGWIAIPGTEVSYPLLQGTDNQYYLEHTWKGTGSSVGSIFLDYQVSADFSDFNTLIYGHRMRNETMFGSLKHYKDSNYWQAHPSIYLVTDDAVCRYDIYAAYEPGVKEITFSLGQMDQETREALIQLGLERSVIETDIEPTAEDRILTLSTCTGRGYSSRWVVQAVLAESFAIEKKDA